jgi:hypothetical protein
MSPTLVGTIVFVCTFGGAVLGMWVRTVLPAHHFDEESRDTVKLGIGLVATMSALVLGLVTASAKSSFDAVDTAVRALQSRALELAEGLLRVRWLVSASTVTSVPLPFLSILLFWLTITFVSFGLFAPRNTTVIAVLVVCALSVGAAVFLVLEMDRPFSGVLKVSAEPLRYAYAHLNR